MAYRPTSRYRGHATAADETAPAAMIDGLEVLDEQVVVLSAPDPDPARGGARDERDAPGWYR